MKILFLVGFWTMSASSSYEPPSKEIYCENILCPKNNHIYCNDWYLEPVLEGATPIKINLTEQQKELVLDTHNELRNIIATGKPQLVNLAGERFPKALNMHKLVWNEELEWQAGLNAATCSVKQDCPSSQNFRYAYQNFAFKSHTSSINETEYIRKTILNWFLEFIYTPLDVIDSHSTKTLKSLSKEEKRRVSILTGSAHSLNSNSHFTTIVKDTTSKIGCSFYTCGAISNVPFSWYLVCNYEFMNTFGESTYKHNVPEPCSKSKKYCGLCLDTTTSEESGKETCRESDIDFDTFVIKPKSSAKLYLPSIILFIMTFILLQ